MGWQDLLRPEQEAECSVAPWLGERRLQIGQRAWTVESPLPHEIGWYMFELGSRTCKTLNQAVAETQLLRHDVEGYLVGDRIVPDDTRVDPRPEALLGCSERVHLILDIQDRFARVVAGRMYEGGPLIFKEIAFPLGPETSVLVAFMDRAESVADIRGVTPALDAAFRLESWHRAETARARVELERLRREAEERDRLENQRREISERLGTGAGRRAMAQVDFSEAARAALAVGGAEYLDHVRSARRGEMTVRFRLDRRSFECVCDEATMRIVDAGICLTGRSGVKGDNLFTLESLPSVIRQAERDHVLVVLRHVGDYDDRDEDEDD